MFCNMADMYFEEKTYKRRLLCVKRIHVNQRQVVKIYGYPTVKKLVKGKLIARESPVTATVVQAS